MAMSYGERQKLDLELRRRVVKELAEQIAELLKSEDVETCYFAASKEIAHQILDELHPHSRAKIAKVISADLTKSDKNALIEQFLGVVV